MNVLKKLTVLLILLFLSGCGHHPGYYSGRGISVGAYIPFKSYSRHDNHDAYIERPRKHKYRNYKPRKPRKRRYDNHGHHYDKHYSRHNDYRHW